MTVMRQSGGKVKAGRGGRTKTREDHVKDAYSVGNGEPLNVE